MCPPGGDEVTLGLKHARLEAATAAPRAAAAPAPVVAKPPKGTRFDEWRGQMAALEAETRSGDPERMAAAMEQLKALDADLAGRVGKVRGPRAEEIVKQIGDIRIELAGVAGRADTRAKKIADEGKAAEKRAGEEADSRARVEQLRARIGALPPESRDRIDPSQLPEMEKAASLGGDPGAIITQAIKPSDEDKGRGKARTAAAEREELMATGQPIPPRLMTREEKDAAWMDRLERRAAFYESMRVPREAAVLEAKRDGDVEKKLHALLWGAEDGRVVRREVDLGAFDHLDELPRLHRLYLRGELEPAAEEEIRRQASVFRRAGTGGEAPTSTEAVAPRGSPPTFDQIDAQVRKEMAGKPEDSIRAEVVRRFKNAAR